MNAQIKRPFFFIKKIKTFLLSLVCVYPLMSNRMLTILKLSNYKNLYRYHVQEMAFSFFYSLNKILKLKSNVNLKVQFSVKFYVHT